MFKNMNNLGSTTCHIAVWWPKELPELPGVLAHPNRIRIIEELRDGERDVNSL